MVEDLTCLFPRQLHSCLYWAGQRGDWLNVHIDSDIVYHDGQGTEMLRLPRSKYLPDIAKLEAGPDGPEKKAILRLVNDQKAGTQASMLGLGLIEAGGVVITQGPKLFRPNFEQFESLSNVDLHIPICDFRSPYPALLIRIPNEWRVNAARELKIDVQRQPMHVLVRTKPTVDGKVAIFTALKYPEIEHFIVVSDNPLHKDLQSAIRFVADTVKKYLKPEDIQDRLLTEGDYTYCIQAVHAALNCCLFLTHFGHREGGYLDPHQHKVRCKTGDGSHRADFRAVDMVQNIILRQTSGVVDTISPPIAADHADDGDRPALWEVRPHWRRGYWRRRPGWREYVNNGQQPPLSFVRPTLVRRDRIIGDIGDSQTTYRTR